MKMRRHSIQHTRGMYFGNSGQECTNDSAGPRAVSGESRPLRQRHDHRLATGPHAAEVLTQSSAMARAVAATGGNAPARRAVAEQHAQCAVSAPAAGGACGARRPRAARQQRPAGAGAQGLLAVHQASAADCGFAHQAFQVDAAPASAAA